MDEAIGEEHAHQTAMDGVMQRMRSRDADLGEAIQAMDDAGMSMMCPMGSHMHRGH